MVLIFCNPPSNIDSEKQRFKRSFKHRLFNENDPKPFMILRPNDSYLSFSENINAEVVVADNNNNQPLILSFYVRVVVLLLHSLEAIKYHKTRTQKIAISKDTFVGQTIQNKHFQLTEK